MQRNGNFKIFNPNNSMYNEIVYRLEKGNSLSFNDCDGYKIIGMHSWNLENSDNKVRFWNCYCTLRLYPFKK